MVSGRNDPSRSHPGAGNRPASDAPGPASGPPEGADEEEEQVEDDRPQGHRHSGGAAGFGPAIAGIMHGIDADIFRDPAAIQRMERDRSAVVRTADGTVIGIELPGEGVIEEPTEGDEPG